MQEITLIAAEAHPARFELIKKHLATNGLYESGHGVSCHLFHGAATVTRCQVFFPDVDVTAMGAAVSDSESSLDNRGRERPNLQVEGYPLDELLGDASVDLLHLDVQGSELALVEANLGLLARQVKAMMIGTHSRTIEGNLIELLYHNGWQLELEKPCRIALKPRGLAHEPATETDGCQYWRRAD